ncbi:hypothetical protein [Nocardia blacklockiae]|uniref:hypothetical protein n=1 Tax=Nocardia blacklockiae TaxID=480036 RepID=UPI0018954BBA|nr:hypothetical protein [Nocardia blacklockiae]MBF6175990.1 hypothetical protein [Nocardia blacklockiae]
MDVSELPADIVSIAEFLARNAEMSGGELSIHELAKMKATLMNEPQRWTRLRVTPETFEEQCLSAGLGAGDAAEVREYLRKAQAGKKLVPYGHRDFEFAIPYDPVE